MKKLYFLNLLLLFFAFSPSQSIGQMPGSVRITPENGTGFDEITLTFYPAYACVPVGSGDLWGLDSIAMHSSAVTILDDPQAWNHIIPFDGAGIDGTLPHLYPDSDTSYSITFTPALFYGTGDEQIVSISAVFNDCFGWEKSGRDFGPDGCMDLYIPLFSEKADVTFRVDMRHQIFLGRFDPTFDFLDVAGNFNDWGNPGTTMTDMDDGVLDSVYSVTIQGMDVGRKIEYKFRINKEWWSAELPFLPNREYVVESGENIVTHYYNNTLPILKTLRLSVNMNYLHETGGFNPVEDSVDVAGTFNNWGSSGTLWMEDPEGDGIYTIEIDSLYAGQFIEYKFRLDATWGRNEFPGLLPNRLYEISIDTNDITHWWNDDDPSRIPGPFFSEYIDGPFNNNALVISNRTNQEFNLSEYGIIYTTDGSDWSAPVPLTGILYGHDSYLIVNPAFDTDLLSSAGLVDLQLAEATSFDGNDALALVRIYDSGNRYRIVDQIGLPGINPGTGWAVAGIPDATAGNRLSRKLIVFRGQPDWEQSAGTNSFDSEWNISDILITDETGTYLPSFDLENQWKVNNTGDETTLRTVDFRFDGKGIAAGSNGIALLSTDYGLTWNPLELGIPHSINDVEIRQGKGWMVGTGGLVRRSTDLENWEDIAFGEGITLESICMLDTLVGYVAGEYILLRTGDGGETWEWLYTEHMDYFRKIQFVDDLNGWALSNFQLIATMDGGENWNQVTADPPQALNTFYFINKEKGWLAGEKGLILYTEDGGVTWTRQFIQTDGAINQLWFLSETRGWAVGNEGKVFFTLDGGTNWLERKSGTENNLRDIAFLTRNRGWIVGDNRTIISTLDGWDNQGKNEDIQLYSLFFIDKGTGWAVGDQGTIYRTLDAGISWDTIPKVHQAPSEPHFDIFFSDRYNGWMATSGGYVYKTIDGGNSWTGIHTGVPEWYLSVFFIDSQNGWATASGSTIARTTNGGDSWEIVKVGTGKNFNDVFFVNSTTGWVAGQEGIIIKSTDGGINWVSQFTPGSDYLQAVYFHDDQNGYAVGSGGTLLRTIDGGQNWIRMETGTGAELTSIYFLNESTGWISGDNGMILHTTDGGNTWNILPPATGQRLNDVFFVDAYNGWAVGGGGTIVKTSSAGCFDPLVDLPRYSRVCDGESAEFDAGDSFSYSWNNGSEERTITADQSGYYRVSVSNACKISMSDSVYLDVKDLPDFNFLTDRSPYICKGENLTVGVDVLNMESDQDYIFSWEKQQMDTSVIRIDTSGFFPLTVTDGFGCKQKDSIEVTVQYPWDEKIALVTYDIEDRRNLVVWKETPDEGTEFYNVYKVQSIDKKLLGSVAFGDLTVFVDTTSRPWQQSDRYVITTVDTCENESFYSASHKTMHMTANLGVGDVVNLIWEHYEGIPVNWYYIYRGSDSTSLALIDSIAYDPTKTQYTDDNPPQNHVYYQIAIKLPEPVVLLDSKKAGSGPFVHCLSNLEDIRSATGILLNDERNNIRLYPNPAMDVLRIEIPGNDGQREWTIKVIGLDGKIVLTVERIISGGTSIEIQINDLEKGYYILELRSGQRKYRSGFMKK